MIKIMVMNTSSRAGGKEERGRKEGGEMEAQKERGERGERGREERGREAVTGVNCRVSS